MGKTNRTSSGDTPIQVGHVGGKSTKPAKPTKPATPEEATTSNVRSGNAKVGKQVDAITGGITIRRR